MSDLNIAMLLVTCIMLIIVCVIIVLIITHERSTSRYFGEVVVDIFDKIGKLISLYRYRFTVIIIGLFTFIVIILT